MLFPTARNFIHAMRMRRQDWLWVSDGQTFAFINIAVSIFNFPFGKSIHEPVSQAKFTHNGELYNIKQGTIYNRRVQIIRSNLPDLADSCLSVLESLLSWNSAL